MNTINMISIHRIIKSRYKWKKGTVISVRLIQISIPFISRKNINKTHVLIIIKKQFLKGTQYTQLLTKHKMVKSHD